VVEIMTNGVRIPEVARRLGIDGEDVYRLLFAGELDGGPCRDGLVYFSEASVDASRALRVETVKQLVKRTTTDRPGRHRTCTNTDVRG